MALAGVLALQVLGVHWGPTQALFRTTDLSAADCGLAVGAACSVLLLDELHKLLVGAFSEHAGIGKGAA